MKYLLPLLLTSCVTVDGWWVSGAHYEGEGDIARAEYEGDGYGLEIGIHGSFRSESAQRRVSAFSPQRGQGSGFAPNEADGAESGPERLPALEDPLQEPEPEEKSDQAPDQDSQAAGEMGGPVHWWESTEFLAWLSGIVALILGYWQRDRIKGLVVRTGEGPKTPAS